MSDRPHSQGEVTPRIFLGAGTPSGDAYKGDLWVDTTNNYLYYYSGTAWVKIIH